MPTDVRELARQAMTPRLGLLTQEEKAELTSMTLGERIRWVIDYLDSQYSGLFNPNRVAERTGIVSITAIYDIIKGETKKPSAFALRAIAKELGVDTDFLISGEVKTVIQGQEAKWYDKLPAEYITFMDEDENLLYVHAALKWAMKASQENLPPEVFEAAMMGAVTAWVEARKRF